MSKIDSIETQETPAAPFTESFGKLMAVESVMLLIGGMADGEILSLNLPDQAELESLYQHSMPMVQQRFDQQCDGLAVMAQSGAQALLQMNSEGRTNTASAARRLQKEIERASRKAIQFIG